MQAGNFVYVDVDGAHSDSATTIQLASGEVAAKLQAPFDVPATNPYNGTYYDSTNFPNPEDDPNREVVRCTALDSGLDQITVTRGQETSLGNTPAASTKNTAGAQYKIRFGATARWVNEVNRGYFDGWSPGSGGFLTSQSLTNIPRFGQTGQDRSIWLPRGGSVTAVEIVLSTDITAGTLTILLRLTGSTLLSFPMTSTEGSSLRTHYPPGLHTFAGTSETFFNFSYDSTSDLAPSGAGLDGAILLELQFDDATP